MAPPRRRARAPDARCDICLPRAATMLFQRLLDTLITRVLPQSMTRAIFVYRLMATLIPSLRLKTALIYAMPLRVYAAASRYDDTLCGQDVAAAGDACARHVRRPYATVRALRCVIFVPLSMQR